MISAWMSEVQGTMAPVPVRKIGEVGGENILIERGASALVDLKVREARAAWTQAMGQWMG